MMPPKNWEITGEQASIVLVGDINPKIFHPEWFIRKEIISEWDYRQDKDFLIAPDFARIGMPNECQLTVFPNKFSIHTSLASEYLTIKDIVINTFNRLNETPLNQLGMNLISTIKLTDKENWLQFGKKLAPQSGWIAALDYWDDLEEEKQLQLGLLDLTMNLPRPDNLNGFIRPRIMAKSSSGGEYILEFSINNHVDIETQSAVDAINIIKDKWEESIRIAQMIRNRVMAEQLENIQ